DLRPPALRSHRRLGRGDKCGIRRTDSELLQRFVLPIELRYKLEFRCSRDHGGRSGSANGWQPNPAWKWSATGFRRVNGSIAGGGTVSVSDENDRSIAVLVQYGGFDWLWASDLGGQYRQPVHRPLYHSSGCGDCRSPGDFPWRRVPVNQQWWH